MTAFFYLSLVVAVVGGLIYFNASNPKWINIGLVSYGAGLLAFLLTFVWGISVVTTTSPLLRH